MFNLKKIRTMKIKANIIKGLGILFIALASLQANAQQDPMYTQYMFNQQTINPAYAGTWKTMGFMVLGRQQWAGFDGAPQTFTFSMQSPLRNERVALGLNMINDRVGEERRFYMFADYSHMSQVAENSYLRLGLKGGFTHYSHDVLGYTLPDGNDGTDASFLDNVQKLMPNFGVGAYLFSEKYYIGFSVPKIINNQFENDMENFSIESEIRHYYLTAGVVFDLGENVKFKPTALTKASFSSDYGTPVQLDVTANFLFKEKFWLGAMYRTGDSYGFLAQWIFDQGLRVGYSYDLGVSELRKHHNGSHEVMVSYEIQKVKNLVTSPRYF